MFISWIDLPCQETFTSSEYTFYETTNLVISSIFYLIIIIQIDLPKLYSFTTSHYSFFNTERLTLSSILLIIII